jgi:hypothetical protein
MIFRVRDGEPRPGCFAAVRNDTAEICAMVEAAILVRRELNDA